MLRIVAVLLLCFVIVSLGWGLVTLMRDRSASTRMVKALSWRVGLSLLLFIMIVVTTIFGITPFS